ncbi:MAG: MlaD family protein [Phycisphaerae bacterium]|jgi:phospholipid/cholesterol/gamma-HCH transport system substrate-binding protein
MSDYDYIQQKRNMIVGAFVIVGVCVFIYMVFLFGELPVAMAKLTSFSINVRFPSAPGVQENTPVQYCGYQIGRVTNVSPPTPFRKNDGTFIHQVMVEMAISKDYSEIPANVKVRLFRRGMGSSFIELGSAPMTPADFNSLEPKYLRGGMILQGESGTASELLPEGLQNKIEEFFTKVTKLVDNTNAIIGDEQNKDNLKNTLANLSKATEESIVTLQQIKEFSQTGKEKLAAVSDSVTNTSEELGATLIEVQRILNKINSSQGTIGKLVNDDRLYENLVNSSEELTMAIKKMQKLLDKTSEKGIQVKMF